MKTRAAVVWKAGAPLTIEEVDLDGPRDNEVLVEAKATGICRTDGYTLSGADREGLFPILGHQGAGVVLEVGRYVSWLAPGDHVIPLYTPECRQCKFCLSRKPELCRAIRATQGKGPMPDGSSCISLAGKPLLHDMGTSTFADHIVVPGIALARVRKDAPYDVICTIGCGVTAGVGAVIVTANVEAGVNAAVFGLGGSGLNLIEAAKVAGVDRIIGIDTNPAREAMARRFGMTHVIHPNDAQTGRRSRESDRRRRRRQLRVHRRHGDDAAGARVLPQGLGPEHHHRRGAGRGGDRDKDVPARHRPVVEGLGLRRRPRPHRRAEDRRRVHGRETQDRRADHAPPAARPDQRGLRADQARRVDPRGGRVPTELLSEHGCFGGLQRFCRHESTEIGLPMRFALYLPPQAVAGPAAGGHGR